MSKEPTVAALKETLIKIANMDIGVTKEELLEMTGLDALDKIVTMVQATLNPVQEPSPMELKIKEIEEFVLRQPSLMFATNDAIGEALNEANILPPSGKPWTRSNVSKTMSVVKEHLAVRIEKIFGEDYGPVERDEPVAEVITVESKLAVVEESTLAEEAAVQVSDDLDAGINESTEEAELSEDEELDVLTELEELEDLNLPDAA